MWGGAGLLAPPLARCLRPGRGLFWQSLQASRLQSHNLHTSLSAQQSSRQGSPPSSVKVWYVPNPFKWLHNHMEIATLQRTWDPSFDLEAFKYGAIQGVCTITELLNHREWGEMCGLLTQKAIDKLRSTKWTADQMHNLSLLPESVQVAVIKNVQLQSIVDQKYCDIDMTIIGTREPYNPDKHSLILMEYFARFHRNYSEGQLPDWTLTIFTLQNFQAVPQRS